MDEIEVIDLIKKTISEPRTTDTRNFNVWWAKRYRTL